MNLMKFGFGGSFLFSKDIYPFLVDFKILA